MAAEPGGMTQVCDMLDTSAYRIACAWVANLVRIQKSSTI